MGIEEKAKAYDAALERAKGILCDGNCSDIEAIFPELRESEDERNDRMRGRVIESLVCYRGKVYDEGDKEVALLVDEEIAWMKKRKEQKPKNILTDDDSLQTAYLKGQTDVLEDPEAYGLQKEQKPAEWSEEDKNKMDVIIRLVEQNSGWPDRAIKEYVNWLKSLRPSWKPTEEHLSALLAVFNDPDNIGSQTCQLALTDLYEQLKKL